MERMMGPEPTTFCMASVRGRSCRHTLALGAAFLHARQLVKRCSRGQGVWLATHHTHHASSVRLSPRFRRARLDPRRDRSVRSNIMCPRPASRGRATARSADEVVRALKKPAR